MQRVRPMCSVLAAEMFAHTWPTVGYAHDGEVNSQMVYRQTCLFHHPQETLVCLITWLPTCLTQTCLVAWMGGWVGD